MIYVDKHKPKELKLISASIKKAIKSTFNTSSEKLPSKNIFNKLIDIDDKTFSIGSWQVSYTIRELYLKNSFIVFTDEMMHSIKKFVDKHNFTEINELCCGKGYFSHWMTKYGIPLKNAVDNKTWIHYKDYLPIVKKFDAVEFVKEHQETELFIVSWPYMDDIVFEIWNNMKSGQYLFYIGESMGGCTANDNFFNAVAGCEIEDDIEFNEIGVNFIQFQGIHDECVLYKKK